MQSSTIVFNTNPILASIHASSSCNHSRDSSNSALCTPKFNRLQSRKAITLRPPQNGCRSRIRSVSSKISRRLSSEYKELPPHSCLSANSQRVSCFHSYNRKQIGVKRFTSGFFTDKSTFHLTKNLQDNTEVRNVQVPRASVGPEEPHAASTTWPDGVTEKPGSDLLDTEAERIEFENFLRFELPSHPKLHRGQLKNGLRYLILPNKVPPNRFEAHMEVHAGSIDEEDDEQGIAHMIEHVAFLGSKKREKLLGTGARSNAYTDFHHTVFHIHSPTSTKDSEGDLLPVVLDALKEIAFHPKFLTSRVEKERRAILSELQMMNTIEYRVDCQLLQYLHSENKLSKRFPIELEEQIKKWDADNIKKFHERWDFQQMPHCILLGTLMTFQTQLTTLKQCLDRLACKTRYLSHPHQVPLVQWPVSLFLS